MGRLRNGGIANLKEIGNDECAVQGSVTGMIIIQLLTGLLPHHENTYYLMMIICLVLLLGLALSAELCNSDVYDSYLEAYPMKCGNDCAEYKEYV